MKHLTKNNITEFQNTIYDYYDHYKRNLPWRNVDDPYKILVSEIMLQQTQVDRVIPKFSEFIKTFPTINTLADAELREVLIAWQGLGYNRRAKGLHNCAKSVIEKHNGKIPDKTEDLIALPGVGKYTAAAIQAFAFNLPSIVIETNIRTVFIHFFFNNKKEIDDKEIAPLIKQTLDKKSPKDWYNALMDYGTSLKNKLGNLSKRSKHYTKQNKFHGSDRQIRGIIITILSKNKKMDEKNIISEIKKITKNNNQKNIRRIKHNLHILIEENMIKKAGNKYIL